jgi:hypothetical protein
MTVRHGFSVLFLWISIPLGVTSLGFSLYFGLDVMKIWMAPQKQSAPLAADAHPIEVVARGVGNTTEFLGGMADGITKGLFVLSLVTFAVAVVFYFISRQIRAGS